MCFNVETDRLLVELGSWVLLAGAHCLKLSPLEEVLLPFHSSHAKNPRPKWSLRQAGAFRLTKWKRKAWQAWSRKEEAVPFQGTSSSREHFLCRVLDLFVTWLCYAVLVLGN